MGDRQFWDKIAAKYAARPVGDEAAYQRKLDETRALLRPDMSLLEIGCGTGTTALAHAPHVHDIRAVDVSGAMLDFGRKAAAERGITNVQFDRAAADTLDPPPASRDMVLMLSLLHLLDDPDAAIAMAARTLKPGGYLVTSTMCMADHMQIVKPVIAVMRWFGQAPDIVRFLRQDDLLAMIERAGLTVETCWRPGKRSASFIIARKPGATGAE